MTEVGINQVLSQIRSLSAAAGDRPQTAAGVDGAEAVDFGDVLKASIDQVSRIQRHSSELAAAFERGDPGVSLAEVMVAGQKASVSFEAAIQVRNRLLEAYREVMSMQV